MPYGGISNRMKCIISSIVEYGHINLKWDIPRNGGGVDTANGAQTWKTNSAHAYVNISNDTYNGVSQGQISDCKFIHPQMNTHNEGGKDKLPINLKERYIKVIKTF